MIYCILQPVKLRQYYALVFCMIRDFESGDIQLIREVKEEDAAGICEIYNHYVTNSIITFEENVVTAAEMERRIRDITATLPWLIHENQQRIQGYAYASQWKSRCAYQYSAEITVYLAHDSVGNGIGSLLYQALIDRLRNLSFHSLIAGIALPNPASIALHEKMGFEKVAHFKEVGWKMNRWIDVGYWELIMPNTNPVQ
ncbi:arsinothricin resistance N-acetyltransferase ArsN1 family B [Gimesia aquarii]|uniref:Phosphinothricin N-acetyltransferase n=1 Tax=Gimesia aquarii TaxID=2527964 RepID=A0A517X0M6_9PLAN|nr:arsinothricin resistance N-acetyltransferase ArsN1 family B [Gimesia aquarii]QDU11067.1 Phosphinothricin N-acetyltransferase [Gimesia aquarii]